MPARENFSSFGKRARSVKSLIVVSPTDWGRPGAESSRPDDSILATGEPLIRTLSDNRTQGERAICEDASKSTESAATTFWQRCSRVHFTRDPRRIGIATPDSSLRSPPGFVPSLSGRVTEHVKRQFFGHLFGEKTLSKNTLLAALSRNRMSMICSPKWREFLRSEASVSCIQSFRTLSTPRRLTGRCINRRKLVAADLRPKN